VRTRRHLLGLVLPLCARRDVTAGLAGRLSTDLSIEEACELFSGEI
jgi:hypothetical protein